jgi:hypothetical protein
MIHEMMMKDGKLQEVIYTTTNQEMIFEARQGHERYMAAQARSN